MLDIDNLNGLEYYDFLNDLYNDTKNKEVFMQKYTRKDCYRILRRIYIIRIKKEYNAFNSMTKERAYKHIKFYFELHGYTKKG